MHRGQRIPGLTGPRLVAGRGTFVNDLAPDELTWIAFLRSPHAHALIRSVDVPRASSGGPG